MRVVSWNMNHWQRRGARDEESWRYLREVLRPDVALLQECVPPADVPAVYRETGIDERRPWGTAVVVFNGDFEPVREVQAEWRGQRYEAVPVDRSYPGTVAAARVNGITFVSAYGMADNGYNSTTMLHILADLEHLHDDHRDYGERIVLAGDWNIGTQWSGRDQKYRDRDAAILALLDGRGLVDCIDAFLPSDRGRLPECRCTYGEDCRHVWTLRHNRWPDIAYQVDYMYASRPLVPASGKLSGFPRVVTAAAWSDAEAWTMSDHLPLVAEIELDDGLSSGGAAE